MTTPTVISPPVLTLALFGPMQVLVQGKPLPRLRSRQSLWLLALLTLRHPRPVEREWLAGTLWPDSDQDRAFSNLRVALSELRSALGAESRRLQSPTRHTLSLDLTGAEVDVRTFDAALLGRERSALEQAVTLYRGPLLEGCHEEWVFQERAVREQNCLHALQTVGDSALSAGECATAVAYYQRAVNLDPWQEGARRGWMEALARKGDTNAALQVYREFVAFLRDDPTAVPDEQTTAIYQRLRAEVRQRAGTHAVVTTQTTVIPVVQGYLPHPLTDLVGREDERLEVALCLRRSRLVTLTGVGGIGKTRLAREVAGEVVREYVDGVWLVALESLTESRMVTQQIASVLGLREEQGRTILQSVTEHLRNKRLLLVLDNCEHLLQASAQVAAHLLGECGAVYLLTTSREPLGITGESVWSVPALAVPEREQLPGGGATLLQGLMGYESVQLFVERAQAVQKGFALSGSNARSVAQVCRQLEGIPLAIELAAARARALSVEQIAARLDNELSLLTGGNRAAQTRQQTLRATLDWSYALLSEAERALLRRLSVFAGGCLLEAAEQVCCGEGVEMGQVLDLLASLVEKSLVTFEAREGAGGRYRLLEMVRQYAAEGLEKSGEMEQVKTRHRDWFLTLAEEAEPQLEGAEQADWLQRLETEHDNLRAALAWSLNEKDEGRKWKEESQRVLPSGEEGLRLVGALQTFWLTHGHLAEGRAWCEAALKAEGAQERTAARAKALNGVGKITWAQSDYTASQAYYEESLSLWRELGDRQNIGSLLNNLGNIAGDQGDSDAARGFYEEALVINRETGRRAWQAINLNNLGSIARHQGDLAEAWQRLEESLAIFRTLEEKTGIAGTLNNLGNIASDQGDYPAARTYYEESLLLKRELGDRRGIASTLNNLGDVARELEDYTSAHALFLESGETFRALGDTRGRAMTLVNLGRVATMQQEYASATAYLQEGLALFREIENKSGISLASYSLGTVAKRQGDMAEAHRLYRESLKLDVEMGGRSGIAVKIEGFGYLAATQSQWERALICFSAVASLRETLGMVLPDGQQRILEKDLQQIREALSETAFTAAKERGRSMTLEQAVAYALEGVPA